MDFQSMIQGLLGGDGNEAPIGKAPKWLRGERVCPLLIGGELFWKSRSMIVRGVPPIGTQYGHADPHILPADFGPIGEPKQVYAGAPHLNGVVPLHSEVGETLAYALGRDIKYVTREISPLWFAYPPHDDRPQLIVAMQAGEEFSNEREPRKIFRVHAFISPSMMNIHHFLLPEDRESLPRFGGMYVEDDDGRHDLGMQTYGLEGM